MAKKYVTTTTILDSGDSIVETQIGSDLDTRIVPNASGDVDDTALAAAVVAQKDAQLAL